MCLRNSGHLNTVAQSFADAELALETNLARYRTGSVEFMPVVDNIRMLLRYRKELSMAVKEYYAMYSELNALKGVEVLK